MKPFWEITQAEVKDCLEATAWYPANYGYFRGGGFSIRFLTRGEMPVTMSRINIVKGPGPGAAAGRRLDGGPARPGASTRWTSAPTPPGPPPGSCPRLTGQGAFTDVYSVMANWGANHGAISYGHIGADLITLAAMLRIPVNMHNLPPAALFRPTAWNAFGTADLESADFRACAALGPLYGKY